MVKWLPISGIQSVLYGVLMALGMYCLFEFLTVCSLTSWLSQGSEVCTMKFRTVSTVFSAHLRISGSVQLTSCLSQGSRHRAPTLLIARTPPACTPQCHRHHHCPPLAGVWKVEDGVRGEGKVGAGTKAVTCAFWCRRIIAIAASLFPSILTTHFAFFEAISIIAAQGCIFLVISV